MSCTEIVKTKRDGVITVSDSGAAHSKVIQFEEGNLSITIPGPSVNVFLDRGRFGDCPQIRYGDDQPMTLTFNGYFSEASGSAADLSLMQIISHEDAANAGWVSVLGSNAEVMAYDVEFFISGTAHGDVENHKITLRNVVMNGSIAEGDPNVITLNGTAYDVWPELSGTSA